MTNLPEDLVHLASLLFHLCLGLPPHQGILGDQDHPSPLAFLSVYGELPPLSLLWSLEDLQAQVNPDKETKENTQDCSTSEFWNMEQEWHQILVHSILLPYWRIPFHLFYVPFKNCTALKVHLNLHITSRVQHSAG